MDLLEGKVERGGPLTTINAIVRVFWRGLLISFRVSCAASRRFFSVHLQYAWVSRWSAVGFVHGFPSAESETRCAQWRTQASPDLDQQANHFLGFRTPSSSLILPTHFTNCL